MPYFVSAKICWGNFYLCYHLLLINVKHSVIQLKSHFRILITNRSVMANIEEIQFRSICDAEGIS